MKAEKATELVPVKQARVELPPILAGRATAAVEAQVQNFYSSVAEIFERWVTRRSSKHTQRAYRQDVMDFVTFLGLKWPDESGLTHHNSESGLAGKPCLLVKSKLLDHIFATFR